MTVRCPDCGVVITCRTDVCPLCGKQLKLNAEQVRALPRAFPPRGKAPLFSNASFDRIYWLIAVVAVAVSFLTEGLITHRVPYSFVVAGLFLYLYFVIRSTLQDNTYFSQKVVIQAVLLTVLAATLWGVLPRPTIIFEWILPILYLLAIATNGVWVLAHLRGARKSLLNLLTVSLMGVIPVVAVAIAGGSFYLLAACSAAVGVIVFGVTVGVGHRNVLAELNRTFHL